MSENAVPPLSPRASGDERHVVVCGLGRFGLCIVEHLRGRSVPVVVITDARTRADRKARAWAMGAHLVDGDFRFPDVRMAARVADARALLLAAGSDEANLEAALDVKREYPYVRIVMRLESDVIAQRLCTDFGLDAVLSPPVLAASEFVRAALEPPRAPTDPAPAAPVRRPRLPGRLSAAGNSARFSAAPVPSLLAGGLVLMFLTGVAVFEHALNLSLLDAVYFTASIVTTVGFGDYNLREAPAGVKVFGTFLMFGGVTLIAVISSFLTNFFLSGAASQLRAERAASRCRGHVILCGLGSVGLEIAEALLARKVPLVIVDATPEDVQARNLAASGTVPLLMGDARRPDVLRRAGLDRARALIAATSNDAVNLEIGLIAQSLAEESRPERPLRLVLRCFDPDLAERIHALSDAYTLLSSGAIAAPIFVDRALSGE